MKFDKNQIYILAGATGTEIYRRGFPTILPLWSAKVLFEKPRLLTEIYLDYINAGAEIITTNTFRTQKRTLAKASLTEHWERINRLAVQLALEGRGQANVKRPILVACSIAPLEDCYRPDLVSSDRQLLIEHQEQADLLAQTDIDFFLLETFNTIREAEVAARAVQKTGKPFAVSFVVNKDGDLLSGESIASAVQKIEPLGPIAFLVNCAPPAYLTAALAKLKKATSLSIGAYGNGNGKPSDDYGWQFNGTAQIESYTNYCREWLKTGAKIIGGCCGTSPEYTKSYSRLKNS